MIRGARCERGWSRPDLAQILKVDPSTVKGWEIGGHRPAETVRPHLARLLDLTLDEVGGDPAA